MSIHWVHLDICFWELLLLSRRVWPRNVTFETCQDLIVLCYFQIQSHIQTQNSFIDVWCAYVFWWNIFLRCGCLRTTFCLCCDPSNPKPPALWHSAWTDYTTASLFCFCTRTALKPSSYISDHIYTFMVLHQVLKWRWLTLVNNIFELGCFAFY